MDLAKAQCSPLAARVTAAEVIEQLTGNLQVSQHRVDSAEEFASLYIITVMRLITEMLGLVKGVLLQVDSAKACRSLIRTAAVGILVKMSAPCWRMCSALLDTAIQKRLEDTFPNNLQELVSNKAHVYKAESIPG